MDLPNYKDGSIVNLMSSILNSYGAESGYGELKFLPSSDLKSKKNIVLIVLDGLGYNYLMSHKSYLAEHVKGRITSVFPPTTASAITSFFTGLSPKEHGVTSWFMNLSEIGVVGAPLRFSTRAGKINLDGCGLDLKDILNLEPVFKNMPVASYQVIKSGLEKSQYTINFKSKKIFGEKKIKSFFSRINSIVSKNEKKFVYAYWPDFDSNSHRFGINSFETEKCYDEIVENFKKFMKKINLSETTVIVTADHGLIDSAKDEFIDVNSHPVMKECLTIPMCGEMRAGYFYVHPRKAKKFVSYVKKNLNKYCDIYTGRELIDKGYYGLFDENPKLEGRIGDYVLIMKKNYLICDTLNEEESNRSHIGHHGGISPDEMYVPFIFFN